jgi:hypothetical protein
VISDNSLLKINEIQSPLEIKMEANDHDEQQTPLFKPKHFMMTEQERQTLEAVLKRNGVSAHNSPDNTQDQLVLEPLLKIAQDSLSSQTNIRGYRTINPEHKPLNKIWVTTSGHIIKSQGRGKEIFGTDDLEGFNFFDLMASYNVTFLKHKFGEIPIQGMARSKANTIIRFSLEHLDEDTNPIIISSKISIKYSQPEPGLARRIIGAIISSRRSSSKGTSELRQRILESIQEAGKIALRQIKSVYQKQSRVKHAMMQYPQCTGVTNYSAESNFEGY